jgi:hypothetical protein
MSIAGIGPSGFIFRSLLSSKKRTTAVRILGAERFDTTRNGFG